MIPVQVTIVTIDPATITEHQKTVSKSLNFSEWLKLLNMYKHNQMWDKVESGTIQQMNARIIIKQSFWIRELDEHKNRLDYDDHEQLNNFWNLMKGGFVNDYDMHQFGEKLVDWIIHIHKNLKKMSQHQAELKIEWLIEKFKWNINNGAKYYQKLRTLYNSEQHNKIRDAYHRQFNIPFTSNDVIFDEYKEWEKDMDQLKKAQKIYELTIDKMDQLLQNIESRTFAKLPVEQALKLMHEDSQYNDFDYHSVIKKQQSVAKRIQLLHKEAKQGKLEIDYLEELEKSGLFNDEEIIKQYNRYIERAINHHSSPRVQVIVKQYLCCLVRRINKHLLKNQSQQYLDSWGEKVTFFRAEIMNLINRVHKGVQLNLYKFWAEVETYVVKDSETVKRVYEQLLKVKENRAQVYLEYAHSLVVLSNVQQALNIMERGIEKSDVKENIKAKYRQMLSLFGTVESNIQDQNQSNESKQQQRPGIKSVQQQEKNNAKKDVQPYDQLSLKLQNQQKRRHHNDSGKTIFVQGVPEEWTKSDVIKLFDREQDVVDVRIIQNHKKRKLESGSLKLLNTCYVEMSSLEAAQKAIKNNRRNDITMSLSKPPRQSEQLTILFAGLPTDATEKDIRDFLKQYDGIDDVRLIMNEGGSRGLAFIQFTTQETYQKAWNSLQSKKLSLKNKAFIMRQCDSERMISKNLSSVAFLQGLSYKASEKDIINFFKTKGINEIKQIEIPKNDQNRSKGFAYVQFISFKDYQKALDQQSGSILGRQFKIKKSNRKITHKKQEPAVQRSNSDFLKLFK